MAVVPTLELHSDSPTIEVIAKRLFHQERRLHCRSLFTFSGSDGKKNNLQLQTFMLISLAATIGSQLFPVLLYFSSSMDLTASLQQLVILGGKPTH